MKRLVLSPVVFLAAILGMVTSHSVKAQDLNSAITLTRSEQYDKAEEMLKQLIQKEPANSKYYFYYGENILQDYFSDTISNKIATFAKTAKVQYDKGVGANPNDPLNYVGLAKVAFFTGDFKTADEMRTKAKSFLQPYKNIKKMVPPAPEYAFTLAKLAESYISEDFKVDSALALPLIREAIKIDSKSKDIYLIAGDIYNLKNDGSPAIKYYNLAQEYDPKSPTAEMKIGSIYVKARSYEAAIPHFQQALALNVNYAPAYRELGALYSRQRKYELSKQNFAKYLDLTKGNIPAMITYVQSLYFAGEWDEVIKTVQEIFAVDKSKGYMNRLIGYAYYEKKEYDKALGYMETLFKTVSAELIIQKDYLYLARILLLRNQDYPKIMQEKTRLDAQLTREKERYSSASTAAEKAKLKPNLDTLVNRNARIDKEIASADVEINKGFGEFAKALTFAPEDKNLLNEVANSYYTYARYDDAAKTWAKLIALGRNDKADYLKLARWYYIGEKYKTADSVCSVIMKMDPSFLDAYVYSARSYSKLDPDAKAGLAKPKFETLIEKAKVDSVKNGAVLMEAFGYLAYHYLQNDNTEKAKEYFSRMITLDPNNKEFKIRGYNGLGQADKQAAGNEKTNEGKLVFLARAQESYNKILALDPANESAKASIKWIQSYQTSVKSGINPNELKGVVKNASGQPIGNAIVRVKDTAAETYTNVKGEFKFEIPMASEVIVFSAQGYKSKEVPVQRPLKAMNIVLEQ
jgi:tetratricopeptide (TPR) repeat protein